VLSTYAPILAVSAFFWTSRHKLRLQFIAELSLAGVARVLIQGNTSFNNLYHILFSDLSTVYPQEENMEFLWVF